MLIIHNYFVYFLILIQLTIWTMGPVGLINFWAFKTSFTNIIHDVIFSILKKCKKVKCFRQGFKTSYVNNPLDPLTLTNRQIWTDQNFWVVSVVMRVRPQCPFLITSTHSHSTVIGAWGVLRCCWEGCVSVFEQRMYISPNSNNPPWFPSLSAHKSSGLPAVFSLTSPCDGNVAFLEVWKTARAVKELLVK